jgi:4-hydroxybenzoate polyprenyltransferase
MTLVRKIAVVLEMIKFEHSVFALPFALISMLLAANGIPSLRVLGLIILACVFARSAAMAFNRIVDVDYDRQNPRTRARALPTGQLSLAFTWAFVALMAILFIFCASQLNQLAFALSPIALIIILGYSYTKRITIYSHFVLGLALSLAPIGAWIAVRGAFAAPPLVLGLGVLLWTAGFDILYACQDYDIDIKLGVLSVPQRLGIPMALRTARLAHAGAFFCFLLVYLLSTLSWFFLLGVIITGGLLLYEHHLVSPHDLSRVNTAFFTVNGLISIFLFLCAALDFLVGFAG